MSQIHPTALVDPKAELDASVSVGPYAVVGPHVRIGARSAIGAHCVIEGHTTIGSDNRIFQFCSLGEISQDKSARRDDDTRVEIGNGNTIREYVTIQRGTLKEQGLTRVGDDNWIMAQAHIAHDCLIGSQTILANGTTLAGHVSIEDHVGLGGYTLVHQFCRVGAHAYTGGGAVVLRDLPPFVIAEGQPARPRGVNTEGLKRRGFTAEDIEAIKDAYKAIYLSGALMSEVKLRLAEMANASPHVGRMLAFIESSKRALSR